MKNLPSLNALRAFEAVARHLSFTKAAIELCVTQGAVSRHVKNLEEELNLQLFLRQPNKLKLTHEGELLYHPIHNAFQQILETANNFQNQNLTLKLVVPPSFATRWLIPRIHKFQEKEPDIQVLITSAINDPDFRYQNDFDAAITTQLPLKHIELESDLLFNEEVFLVCKPELITPSKPLNTLEDISNHCILHSYQDRREWNTWCTMVGINNLKNISEQCFELEETLIHATIAGFGLSLINVHFIRNELASNRLILPLPKLPSLSLISYQLTYHPSKSDFLPLKKFRKWLLKEKPGSDPIGPIH